MPITFDRTLCCNLAETISREWFITNGLGGYAAGTIAGTLTRKQQGLLVAALDEEEAPQLLLAKIDEEVLFDQRTYYLGTNEYREDTLNPAGFVHLEAFRLEEGFPLFTYRLGGADGIMLEKRIWMPQEQNTIYIQYRVLRTSAPHTSGVSALPNWRSTSRAGSHNDYPRPYAHRGPAHPSLTLTLLPLVAHRPYNQAQEHQGEGQFQVHTLRQQTETLTEADDEAALALPRGCAGCTIQTWDKKTPSHILAIGHSENHARFIPTGVWYWNFQHRQDQAAGLSASDHLYLPGVVRAQLWPDQDSTLTIIVSSEEIAALPTNQKQINQAYEQALDYQRSLQGQSYFGEGGGSVQALPVLPFATTTASTIQSEEFLQLLNQAGNRLLTQRTLPYQDRSGKVSFFFRAAEHIPSITPGYYEQGDETREILIALPGLTISTRRYSEAQRILRYLGRNFRQGLLPNRLPTAQRLKLEDEDYSNVDVTLWYFHALDKYLSATHDYELLDELYLRLTECIDWYTQGTFHGIRVDARDGLLRSEASELALTWMNATIRGVPVTPRSGKAVEVNALWYHALSLMHEWSQILFQRGRLNYNRPQYAEQAERCRRSFNQRFWYADGGYLYDVIDGPEGNDACLRPNQLLASSLHHAILDADRQSDLLDKITQQLLTPCGLRTLAPSDPGYQGKLPAKSAELPHALHQGAAWPWLVGPYIDALLKVGGYASQTAAPESQRLHQPGLYQEYIWRKGLQVLEPFRQHMPQHMLGHISKVYAGDAPHNSGPCLASAISVGEILRIYSVLAHMGVQHSDQALSV